jgi:protein-disulfide isomerase
MRTCALLVAVAAAIGCGAGCADRRAAAAPESPPQPAPLAAPQPTAGELPVDLSELRDAEKAAFHRLVQKYPSACGKAHSLETSIRTDPRCRRSVFAARYLVRLLKAHLLESEVEEKYELRFTPQNPIAVDVKDAPMRGEPHAPVALVEFSDFQCPHCKHLQPALERILDEYRGQVRLYFKNYPIGRAHPDAALAAAAALAAGRQGKFWQFHDRLWAGDQEHEELPVLEKHARDLKLDLKKWKADLENAKEQVARDHAEGEKLDVAATPTLFINGRKYNGPPAYEDIKDWIEEELNK